jgi:hypothetical protein
MTVKQTDSCYDSGPPKPLIGNQVKTLLIIVFPYISQ